MHRTVLVIMGLALLPMAARADTVDEVIAKHVAARGGAEALKAISSVTYKGRYRPAGFDADFIYSETIARGGRVRMNFTLQGLTVVQSYDGQSGWQIMPFQGRKDPENMAADDVKSLQEEADIEGALVDYKAKGATVEDLGVKDVDGAPTRALRVQLKNGDTQTWYLDPDAWLAVRVSTRTRQRGVESVTDTDYGDYEKVAGVYFPFEQESGPQGSTHRQRITLEQVVVNGPFDERQFSLPTGPEQSQKTGASK